MSKKMSLIERVKSFLKNSRVNIWRATSLRNSPSSENNFIAAALTTDRLHQILRDAESGHCGDLFDLYRDIISADAHIQSEFFVRKARLLGEQISVFPFDEKNKDDILAADFARDMLESIPDEMETMSFLMDSCLYPVSVLEKVFKPSKKPGLAYELDKIIPVPHKLLDFSKGDIRIFKCDEFGIKTSESYVASKEKYIIHRNHILSSPDYWGGPMRAILFWWLISAMDITWWSQWLERYGLPFLIGKYDANDDEGRYVLQQAFSLAARIGGIVSTKETDIDFINALSSQNGDAYEKLLVICHRQESKLILGQTLSSEAQPTGLGSGVANSHENVRSDIALFDMRKIAVTLKNQLVKPFLEYNGFVGRLPRVVVGGETEEDLNGIASMLTALTQSGLRVGDDGLDIISKRCGFPIERVENPTPQLFSARTPTAKIGAIDACDLIAENASAELAPRLCRSGAAVLQLLEASNSPEEFESLVKRFCAKWDDAELHAVIQDVLATNVINGVSRE